MQWKSVKFWCWIEVLMPTELGADLSNLNKSAEDILFGPTEETLFGAGPQGPQASCDELTGTAVCFDILSFQSEFELNSIPSAAVSVAIGRRADDTDTAAQIHFYVDDFKLQLPATVWCTARVEAGSSPGDSEWPDGAFKVFVGNVTGSNFRRSPGGAEFTLSLTHWLSALNFSSAVSAQSHPLNPSQLFFHANHSVDAPGSGGTFVTSTGAGMVGLQLAKPFFTTDIINEDIWGGLEDYDSGIKDWFLYLTRLDRINRAQLQLLLNTDTKGILNQEACRALKRFEPNAVGPDFDETGSSYVLGVPLGFPGEASINGFIANAIGQEIGMEGLSAYEQVTLWDKLAGQFHSNYLFSVVPLVEKALVVPFVPGLSSGEELTLVHRVIRTSQYDSIDLQTQIPRPLRAVGLILGKTFEAGSGMEKGVSAPYASFGGYFDKYANSCSSWVESGWEDVTCDTRYKEGLIMFKQGPKWMSNFVSKFLYSKDSVGKGDSGTKSTTISPGSGDPASTMSPRDVYLTGKPIWDLYARSLYAHEILKNRQGVITGPVRFDIAPGSQIMIEATEDKYVKALVNNIPPGLECDDLFFTWMWCSVLRVSTLIDCQNMRAFTSFHIAHIRNADENHDNATSLPEHPLWQTHQWAGCVLVQNTAFAPMATKT